jgi:uncharacterized protein (DUF427 family)
VKAIVAGTVIAEANEQDLVAIEGNWYFPPSAVAEASLEASATPYTCPWKGDAQYYDVVVDGKVLPDGAWCYPEPYSSALERVGKDFAGYLAFDPRQVDVLG